MKTIIFVSIVTSLLILVGCKVLNKPSVPIDYYTKVQAASPIESKYTKLGGYSVKSKSYSSSGKAFTNCKIWYPSELENSNKKYPVVVFANGTGVPYTKYEVLFEHLASWGFIAVGNDDKSSWSGLSSSQSLDLLLSENSDNKSVFYQKTNTDQIGISGHSQGGVGVINAVTNQANGHLFHAAFGASTPKHELAVALKWSYDISKIVIPYFAVAGTESSDAGDGKDKNKGIAPLWSMIDNYNKLPTNTPTVRARRKDTKHGQMLYNGDGYMTAWFLYTLTNNSESKQIFVGNNPELKQNPNWQDVEMKNLK